MRVTSQAATALPGMVATPITDAGEEAPALSSRSKRLEERRLAQVERRC